MLYRDALGSLQSLRHLYLDDNIITNLTRRAFGNLPAIADISLSGNKLNNVSVGAFEGLRQLQNLDMSRNNLTWLPPGVFQSKIKYICPLLLLMIGFLFLALTACRNLNLSHNRLDTLQNRTHGLFEDLQSIRKVGLAGANRSLHDKYSFRLI